MNNPRTKLALSNLSHSQNSGQALRVLYDHQKSLYPKFSLQFLAKKAKLASKGYLSDVMSGRRRLNSNTAAILAKVFLLASLEKRFFITMVELENEKSVIRGRLLKKRLESLRIQIKGDMQDFPEQVTSRLLFSRVFCAIGMFESPPLLIDIAGILKDQSISAIEEVALQLENNGAIKRVDGRLEILNARVVFGSGPKLDNNIAYLSESIDFAKNQIPSRFLNRSENYFESSIISVKKSQFFEALPRIREFFDLLQTELETASGADDLAYFNIQVFNEGLSNNQTHLIKVGRVKILLLCQFALMVGKQKPHMRRAYDRHRFEKK